MKTARLFCLSVLWFLPLSKMPAAESAVIDIGDRRELFVDEFLIERKTDLELKLH